MGPDSGLGARTTICPACHAEIEVPPRATDAEGNYSMSALIAKSLSPVTFTLIREPCRNADAEEGRCHAQAVEDRDRLRQQLKADPKNG